MRSVQVSCIAAMIAAAITVAGCRNGKTAAGGPLRQLGESELAGTGETLFVLTGGKLDRTVEVPLWIELDTSDDELKCRIHTEHVFFELPDGLVYVGQYNSWCGKSDACRILDPATRRFSRPTGGCISPSGVHMRIEALGGKEAWLAVYTDAEGVAWVDYVTYSPLKGPTEHLHVDLAHDGRVKTRVTENGLELSANFDLLDPPEGLIVAGDGTAKHDFTWSQATGLVHSPKP